jgi:hypothetical protein
VYNSCAIRGQSLLRTLFHSGVVACHVTPLHWIDNEHEPRTAVLQECITACQLPILYISVPNVLE